MQDTDSHSPHGGEAADSAAPEGYESPPEGWEGHPESPEGHPESQGGWDEALQAELPPVSPWAAAMAKAAAYLWFFADCLALGLTRSLRFAGRTIAQAVSGPGRRAAERAAASAARLARAACGGRFLSWEGASAFSLLGVLFLTGFAWHAGGGLRGQAGVEQAALAPQGGLEAGAAGAALGGGALGPGAESGALRVWPANRRQAETESLALLEAWETGRDLRITLARGDTLSHALVDAGIDREASERVITALREVYDPRNLRAGQTLHLRPVAGRSSGLRLLHFAPERGVRVEVRLAGQDEEGVDIFAAGRVEKALAVEGRWAEGRIESSLYLSAVGADVPLPVLARAIQIFSFSVDFQRDIRRGDRFALFYETWLDEAGEEISSGDLLFGELILRGKRHVIWAYEFADEGLEYYDGEGNSVRKGLMRTPIDGARLSSGYGMRKHPILGYNKLHRGLDFAAPTGTPIYAAGNGTVEAAGRNGGYGNYIRLRHSGGYKTAYGHLSKFARGIKRGAQVEQGQVIGYVGSTGLSTGPHLHYEIHINGEQVNPSAIDLPSGQPITPGRRADFEATRERIFARIQRSRGDERIAALATCSGPLLACEAGAASAGAASAGAAGSAKADGGG